MSTKKKALISFAAFIIVVIKYLLIIKLKVIPPYGPLHREISYFLIFPLMLVGAFCSLWVIWDNCFSCLKNKKRVIDLDLIMALPILIWFVYIFY
jgi:hypothetical protein